MFTEKRKGFSLIELLVVIAIIGILSAVVIASLDTARKRGRDTKRVTDIKQLQLALAYYFDVYRVFPGSPATLMPTYIGTVPTDPLDNASYSYVQLDGGNDYHLGANVEQLSTVQDDADATSAGGGDFSGADSLDCAGGSSAITLRYCYDVKASY